MFVNFQFLVFSVYVGTQLLHEKIKFWIIASPIKLLYEPYRPYSIDLSFPHDSPPSLHIQSFTCYPLLCPLLGLPRPPTPRPLLQYPSALASIIQEVFASVRSGELLPEQ